MLENLKKMRVTLGITQRELAEAVSVSQQSINKYENHNIEPDIATMIRLADYFHTSVDYLIGHSDAMQISEALHTYKLSAAESSLINNYRRLSKKQQDSILLIIENYRALK